MKRAKWLGILVVMILAMSLGIGTIAGANTTNKGIPQKPQEPQKIELKSFLENILDVRPYRLPDTDEFLKIVVDKSMAGNYIIEVTPRIVRIVELHGHYFVKIDVEHCLLITPKDNVKINSRKVALFVDIYIHVSDYDNPKDLLRFLEDVVKAMIEHEKISMEVAPCTSAWNSIISIINKNESCHEIHFIFYKK